MNENEVKTAEQAAKAGFTLIEIIIAIAIVGIMAAVAVPNINKNIKRARIRAAQQLVSTVSQALTTYSLDHSGKFPDESQWVEALTGGDDPEIEGGEGALNDPWGNQLVYKRSSNKGNRFLVYSMGPNGTDENGMGEEDGGDDIPDKDPKKFK